MKQLFSETATMFLRRWWSRIRRFSLSEQEMVIEKTFQAKWILLLGDEIILVIFKERLAAGKRDNDDQHNEHVGEIHVD